MDFIRRKTVTIDGAEFLISNLTFKQTRALSEAEEKLKAGDGPAHRKFRLGVVAQSMNRAAKEATQRFIVEDVEGSKEAGAINLDDVLDPKSLTELFFEILGFSGLTIEVKGASPEVGASGESKA